MSSVIVSFSGGLGNQLFQYAAGMELSKRLKVPLFAETEFYKTSPNRRFVLDSFDLEFGELSGISMYRMMNLSKYYWQDLIRKGNQLVRCPFLFNEDHFEYDPRIMSLTAPVYLKGYWQSEKYFPGVANEMKTRLQLKLPESMMQISGQIDDRSVCLHLRHGDFMHNPEIARIIGVCGIEYYRQAVKAMNEKIGSPRFFIFTDEPAAVDLIADLIHEPVIVNRFSKGDDLAEFALMQKFGNFIIANSTFSWWAAWSSLKYEKMVICPVKWFSDSSINTKDLCPRDWIKY